ncbi:MAG: MotA/TolQ/ExbB proton channel family protein, partial [Thermoguttaceae bacterium]|nr:MotA/TolQ/ExbB proton channel family protein [Thermoguttaceae bacterium]
GFRGGRFTKVNPALPLLVAVLLSAAFYGAVLAWGQGWFVDMFIRRGPTQYATVFFTAWALGILWFKWRKLRFQRLTLEHLVVPDSPGFVLAPTTVDEVVQRIYQTVDEPRHFTLFNRITVALANLRNLGRVTDVDDILRSQAEQDEAIVESSYALVEGFVWAIPVLGFIGTVLGLSQAIGEFTTVLSSGHDVTAIAEGLRGVTAGLATAFETTLVALVAALAIQLLMVSLRRSESEFLEACAEYCTRHIVGRLRLLPFETDKE